jgi:hypothetical protein
MIWSSIRLRTHLESYSHTVVVLVAAFFVSALLVGQTEAQTKKPNILVIWGDDVGITNISA